MVHDKRLTHACRDVSHCYLTMYTRSVRRPLFKKIAGSVLIVLGLLALVTPFTPGSWLIFIGLEFFGIRLVAWDRVKRWWQGRKDDPPIQ